MAGQGRISGFLVRVLSGARSLPHPHFPVLTVNSVPPPERINWWRVVSHTLWFTIIMLPTAPLLFCCGATIWINFFQSGHNDKEDVAGMTAAKIRSEIQRFQARYKTFPATLDDLVTKVGTREPLIDGGPNALIDPWGNRYQFEIRDEGERQEVVVWTTTPKGKVIQRPRPKD